MKLEQIMEGVFDHPYSSRSSYMDHLYGDWWRTKKGGIRKNLAKGCPYTLKEIQDTYFHCPSAFRWNVFDGPSPAMSVWEVWSKDGIIYCDDMVWNVGGKRKQKGWIHNTFDIVAINDGTSYTLVKKRELIAFIQREGIKPVALHEEFIEGDCDNGRFWDVSLSFPVKVSDIPDPFFIN